MTKKRKPTDQKKNSTQKIRVFIGKKRSARKKVFGGKKKVRSPKRFPPIRKKLADILKTSEYLRNTFTGIACNCSNLYSRNSIEIIPPTQMPDKLHDNYKIHELIREVVLPAAEREYVVFNVFTDIARLFGYKRGHRSKRVAFPDEVLEQYEQKGDVAGKDRFVPESKQPYQGLSGLSFTKKKRKLSTVYSNWSVKPGGEFAPRVARIGDYGKCEYFCERNCIACECCECDCCIKSSKKPNFDVVMAGYTNDLNVASLFLHSHAARTFETAMGTLEFTKLHAFSLTTMTTIASNKLSYQNQRLGVLSTSIWIFGYCMRTMISMAEAGGDADNSATNNLPSESGFKKVLEQFATICMTVNQNANIMLQYSQNFYNFCKECIRLLNLLQIHLSFRSGLTLEKPLKHGDGLKLNRNLNKGDIAKQASISVRIARSASTGEGIDGTNGQEERLTWKNFEDSSGVEKIHCIRHLLNNTLEGANTVQTQLRFLLDDIVDSLKDMAEADLLFLLADMHDRVKFLANQPKKYKKTELAVISKLMKEFCSDFQCFIDVGQHIMKRFIEYRDMVHVTYELLLGLKLDSLSKMVPPQIFRKRKGLRFMCGGSSKSGRGKKYGKQMPKYTSLDFFRVYYNDAFNNSIYAHKYHISIRQGTNTINAVVPKGLQCKWGELDGFASSPRPSFDEYVDFSGSEEETVVAPPEPIKPILVASTTASPVVSPRGSFGKEEKQENFASSSPPAPTQINVDENATAGEKTTSGATGDKPTSSA